jgi:hypothetical protein
MRRRTSQEEWFQQAEQVFDQLEAFNTGHPHGNWIEIERAIDGAFSGLKRDLLATSIHSHALCYIR